MATQTQNSWKREQLVRRALIKGLEPNLDAAALFYVRFIRQRFPDSGVSGTRSGATKAQRAANRSKPWGVPHVDTGHLRKNVDMDKPRRLTRRIGTGVGNAESVGYAMWLEFGTRKMLPRPWLRPGIWYGRDQAKRLLTRKVRLP